LRTVIGDSVVIVLSLQEGEALKQVLGAVMDDIEDRKGDPHGYDEYIGDSLVDALYTELKVIQRC